MRVLSDVPIQREAVLTIFAYQSVADQKRNGG
jgi:hypothetical protein